MWKDTFKYRVLLPLLKNKEKKIMEKQSYKKRWAFLLILAMAFATLFGGFGSLGIKGVVEEVYADSSVTAYTIGAPEGTIGSPTVYAITTEEQLRDLATSVSSDSGIKYENTTFELTNDIVITGNWIPIGTNGKPFSGTFDGKSFKITGIKIGTSDTPDNTNFYVGFFGNTSGSSIKNLGVSVQINSSRLSANIGGLVGYGYYGTITNCYATGDIAGGMSADVGGLVGYTNGGIIDNCFATINLSGENGISLPTFVGGLVGSSSHAAIKNCYATGAVTGADFVYVGGLVGSSSDGTIRNCYATGNVTAGNYNTHPSLIGGLVGQNIRAEISNCYATGNITAGSGEFGTNFRAGGLVGYHQENSISNGYWNNDAIHTISGAAIGSKLAIGTTFGSVTVSTTSMNSIGMTDSSFVTMLNNWVSNQGSSTYYTWKAATNSSENGGYPLLDMEWTQICTMTASSLTSFGSQAVGYASAPVSQTITITNTGNQVITVSQPTSTNYTIGMLSSTTLAIGSSVTFTVQPNTNLAAGTYSETINIIGSNSTFASVLAQFVVTDAATSSSTGSGSGGSSSGSTSATTVINTNTGNITGNQLNNAVGITKNGGTVTIKSNKTNEVTLPNSGLGSLAGKNNSLTVVTENGTLTFDSKSVAAMGTQSKDTEIKVIVDDVVKTTLTEVQQTKVGDKTVYDLSVISGGKLISSFNGGRVNVSIPYEIKTDEPIENLTVWYMADNGNLTEINCNYDAKNKTVAFVVDHFSKYIIGYDDLADWANSFTDVKSSAWYYNAVAFVNENGLMKGQTDITFGPQDEMTRSMFVAILGRMEGIDAALYANKNVFTDVNTNQYYSPYIAWASENGIVTGIGKDKFAPNAAVTREQMSVMMTNYMKYKEQGPKGEWAAQITYGDLDKVSSWANEGVMFMTTKNLMKGMGNDANGNSMFEPKLTSTRAQAAQVMMNLNELLKYNF